MARGKKSLLETTDLPIVETDKEEGQLPYFLIDDDWGIACDERNEILVRKRIASRTVVNDDTNEKYVEQYTMWDSICYPSNFTNTINCYVDKKSKELKKKITRTKDIKKVLEVENEIKNIIARSLKVDGVNKEFLSVTSILDERTKLEEELKLLRENKEKVELEVDKLLTLVKEKRSIIIKEIEPKKHRVKLEDS